MSLQAPENSARIIEAARRVEAGELVAFPTETVYGLGADAANPQAVAKIYAAKGRPREHPLIVHIADQSQLERWALAIPLPAIRLAQALWPGPLTMVLKHRPGAADACLGGQDTIALRCPAHPMALALLRAFRGGQGGIAAPSANRFGRVSPTTAAHVREELGDSVTMVLDGGPCEVGIESTIIDLSQRRPTLLRPGMITRAMLEAILGEPVGDPTDHSPRVSGSLLSHYAPSVPARLLNAAALDRATATLTRQDAVLSLRPRPPTLVGSIPWIALTPEPRVYARQLFAALRALDVEGVSQILIEDVPGGSDWEGIRDRLQRAATAPDKR